MEERRCTGCGNIIPPEGKGFCPFCGTPYVETAKPKPSPKPSPKPVTEPTADPNPNPKPTVHIDTHRQTTIHQQSPPKPLSTTVGPLPANIRLHLS